MMWKNGGGSTTEIAAEPQGAGFETLAWRVSIAEVAADGPFSVFPGIDRSIIVLDGDGIVLTVGDQPPMRLTPQSAPFAFSGDAATHGALIGGPISDLNVMTRRGRIAHRLRRLDLAAEASCAVGCDQSAQPVIVVLAGRVALREAAPAVTLARHDAIVLDRQDAGLNPTALEHASVALVEFYRD